MTDVFQLVMIVVDTALVFFLFYKISGKKLTWKEMFIGFMGRLALATIWTLLAMVGDVEFFRTLTAPLYSVLLSFYFLKGEPTTLKFFYGLLPDTLTNILSRTITFFIFPVFGGSFKILEDITFLAMFSPVTLLLTIVFLQWLQYNFSQLRKDLLGKKDKQVIQFTNGVMVVYHVTIQILTYLDHGQGLQTLGYRRFIVIFYLVFFMGVIHQLDRHLRERLQEKLDYQRELQIKNTEQYSQHVEQLYREVRSFRHDYVNLLTTLQLGIENKDLSMIEEIYQSVLKDSNKQFRKRKYDVGRLVHIQNNALKSLLAAKFMQASANHIEVSIEVPEGISPQGMELVDLVTIVSILCDNAIESNPDSMRMAYLSVDYKHLFILENSIEQESVPVTHLQDFGESSKGKDRGLGLYNVMQIIERYPNVSIQTTSQNYSFCQVLEIML